MTNTPLGKLVRLDARAVWESEPHEFTPWLAENLDLLGEAIGLDIEMVQQEMPVGKFSLDIFAKDIGSGREIIIENQLDATDHSHLGQLLTYAAGLDAKVIIWISPQFRDEHRQAVDWLNQNSVEDVSFFAVELEIFRIADSPPAPNFKLAAQPSEWQKLVKAETKHGQHSDRQVAYQEFFADLLSRLKKTDPAFTSASRVGYDNWITFSAGRSGFGVGANFFTGGRFRVELYIDTGDHDTNKRAFDMLLGERADIEDALGESLEWTRLENRRASRIYAHLEGDVTSPPDTLEALKGWGVDMLVKFKGVLGPRVKALRLEGQMESSS